MFVREGEENRTFPEKKVPRRVIGGRTGYVAHRGRGSRGGELGGSSKGSGFFFPKKGASRTEITSTQKQRKMRGGSLLRAGKKEKKKGQAQPRPPREAKKRSKNLLNSEGRGAKNVEVRGRDGPYWARTYSLSFKIFLRASPLDLVKKERNT